MKPFIFWICALVMSSGSIAYGDTVCENVPGFIQSLEQMNEIFAKIGLKPNRRLEICVSNPFIKFCGGELYDYEDLSLRPDYWFINYVDLLNKSYPTSNPDNGPFTKPNTTVCQAK